MLLIFFPNFQYVSCFIVFCSFLQVFLPIQDLVATWFLEHLKATIQYGKSGKKTRQFLKGWQLFWKRFFNQRSEIWAAKMLQPDPMVDLRDLPMIFTLHPHDINIYIYIICHYIHHWWFLYPLLMVLSCLSHIKNLHIIIIITITINVVHDG